jgi:uncharacterized protein YebE (UPF0316 family)
MIPGELVLPVLILIARIIETSLETIRTVYISRGHMYLSSVIGMVKVGIWVISTGIVLTNLSNIPCLVAYIAGYGIGTLVGMAAETRIAIGSVIVRVFNPRDPDAMIRQLGDMGFGVTRVNGSGKFLASVAVLLLVVPRKELNTLLAVLKTAYPDVLFTVEDISTMSEGGFYYGTRTKKTLLGFLGWP